MPPKTILTPPLPPSSPLKRLLDGYLPLLYRPLRAVYHTYAGFRFRREYARLAKKIMQARGTQVMSGPFQGMKYLDSAYSSALLPKLLGTYEDELHPTLANLLAKGYDTVVDIGCAEGYYAVGLALRLPRANVWAYDIDPVALKRCGELAELNGVRSRVDLRSPFNAGDMLELRGRKVLVVCDVDGYEVELFAEGMAKYWAGADLLVELHDFIGTPCRSLVERCLNATHRCEIVESTEKSASKIADFTFLTAEERRLAVSELRAPQEWLIAFAAAEVGDSGRN